MTNERVTVYNRRKGGWLAVYESTDPREVYKRLAEALFWKKCAKCRWIDSIRRAKRDDGMQTITVYSNRNIKEVYTVKI